MALVVLGRKKINYTEEGEGHPLVLITGLGGDTAGWAADSRFYGSHFRCICIDNRGMAGTGPVKEDLLMKDMAEDVIDLLDYLSIDKTHILGLSMGGAIAQEVAVLYPERVEKLILSATWAQSNEHLKYLFRVFSDLIQIDFDLYIRTALSLSFGPDFYDKHKNDILAIEKERHMNPFSIEAFVSHCHACIWHNTFSRLNRIKATTLITMGDSDVLLPMGYSLEIAEALKDVETVTFKDCGHLHIWERPDEYHRLTEDFLSR